MSQQRMWQTDDLPLFSGTPIRVEPLLARDERGLDQPPLPCRCRLCRDTGTVVVSHSVEYCVCEAGQAARLEFERIGREEDDADDWFYRFVEGGEGPYEDD